MPSQKIGPKPHQNTTLSLFWRLPKLSTFGDCPNPLFRTPDLSRGQQASVMPKVIRYSRYVSPVKDHANGRLARSLHNPKSPGKIHAISFPHGSISTPYHVHARRYNTRIVLYLTNQIPLYPMFICTSVTSAITVHSALFDFVPLPHVP